MYSDFNNSKLIAERIKEDNPLSKGPYDEWHFNGAEAKVVIYVTDMYMELESLARAQQLLLILTHGDFKQNRGGESFKLLNKAVKQNLIKKIDFDEAKKCSIL